MSEVRDQLNTTETNLSELLPVGWTGDTDRDQLVQRLRISCATSDFGPMVNTATEGDMPSLRAWNQSIDGDWKDHRENHIWCGLFPSSYLSNWPNLAMFVVFTVCQNTGTTVHTAVQGLVGTILAAANMHVMVKAFPHGARGYPCLAKGDAQPGGFYVIWYSRATSWHVVKEDTLAAAWHRYIGSDTGGLKARVIFHPDGKMDNWAKWFAPGWEELVEAKYTSLFQKNCQEGEMVYLDPNYGTYGKALCFVDFAVVTFLFLLSKSARNTMLFGLSWHAYWMMNFMNPNMGVDSPEDGIAWTMTEYFVVEATSVLGAVVAILATFVPRLRLFNTQHLADDLNAVTFSITEIWFNSCHYLAGSSKSAKRFQIETAIDRISSVHLTAQEHIGGAWWETFDLASCGRMRRLLGTFSSCAMDIKDMLYVVKSCVLSETFTGEHDVFMQSMQGAMFGLLQETQALMWVISSACTDGHIDDEEVQKISDSAEKVREAQAHLVGAFRSANPQVSADLAEEQLFLFALSMWARKMTDFADNLVSDPSQKAQASPHLHQRCRNSVVSAVWQGIVETWAPSRTCTKDHLLFAVRNWLSILVCFLIGYFAEGSIFVRYSSVMPVTLSLLIIADGSHIVEYEKATRRLLGVTLGKSLPIVAVSLLNIFPCVSMWRVTTQGLLIITYVTFWMFVYFDSDMWGYVANLVAGFGVGTLMSPCDRFNQQDVYVNKYKELGNVTIAIILQGALQAVLQRHSVRTYFVHSLRKLTSALEDSFNAVFASDIAGLQTSLQQVALHLAAAKAVGPECDPRLKLWRGSKVPFKIDFCHSLLRILELLHAELALIYVAVKDWVPNAPLMEESGEIAAMQDSSLGILELMNRSSSMKGIKKQLRESISLVSEVLPRMFSVKINSGVDDKLRRPEDVRAAMQLEGSEHLYTDLATDCRRFSLENKQLTDDMRVRVTIAVWSLQSLAFHLGKAEEGCIKESHYL